MDTGNKAMIRDMNTNFILKTIIEGKALSRADIAKQSGLTKATVSAIVRLLLDRGLIAETGIAMTDKGRKPIILNFCPDAGCILAFDIGRTKITVLAANLAGQSINTFVCPTPDSRESLLPLLENIIETMSKALPETTYGLVSICVGIHGIVNDNYIRFTPYYPYSDIDIKTPLESRFHIPVYVENEANLSVIAEQCYSFDCGSLVAMSIHSGIGLGIILDNRFYTGHNGCAGEFGHSTVELNGRPCPCGNRGCLEQYASELAILKDYAALKHADTLPDIGTLIKNYEAGEPDAVAVINRFTDYIAVGDYWVGFSGSDAAAIIGATGFSKEKPVLLGQENSPLIKNYLLQIYEARGQDFSHAVKMTGLLYLTLSLFLKPSDTAAKNDGALTYVQNAITYMNYHYPYDISIDDVAAFTGISRSHLYRIFMSHTGQSPKAYLSALRIRQACTLLKKSEISITAIAASVGFENSLYFSKVFKRLKGMTPTEYREN